MWTILSIIEFQATFFCYRNLSMGQWTCVLNVHLCTVCMKVYLCAYMNPVGMHLSTYQWDVIHESNSYTIGSKSLIIS